MTEEIIINDVNVAGCEFLENDEFDCLCLQISNRYEMQTSCKNKDCYYKQLKRLEQENSLLSYNLLLKEQENKELEKQHYETLKMLKHEYDGRQRDNEQWFTRCTENHNEDSKIIEKYRFALEEIKEIAKFNQFYNPEDLLINGDIGQIQDLKMTEIYNKINEVLNDN